MTTPPRTRTADTPDTTTTDWERRQDESPEAWQAFQIYRDQGIGQRSIRGVAQTEGKDPSLISRWSSRHGWIGRVAAYDRHLDTEMRRAREEEVRRLGERQARHLEAAGQGLLAPIQSLLRRVAAARARGESVDAFADLSMVELTRLANQAARYVPSVVEAERLVRGLSTANVADGAPMTAGEARAQAEGRSRDELEAYLTGIDDGRRNMLEELTIPEDEMLAGEGPDPPRGRPPEVSRETSR